MFGNVITKCRNLKYGHSILLGLIAIIVLALTYAATVPQERVYAGPSLSGIQHETFVKETKKQAILRLMKENSRMPEHVLSKIYSVAMHSFNADLILAVCLVESNFNPNVESEKGAIGLMGIMPDVWLEELKMRGIVTEEDDLYTISKNIKSGAYVLETYLARAKDLREALSRYAGGDPAYAARVLRMFGEISRARRSGEQPYLEAMRTES